MEGYRSNEKQNHRRQAGHQHSYRRTRKLDQAHMVELVRQCAALHRHGHQVVVVTSALSPQVVKLGYPDLPPTMPNKQMLAAVGQCHLMQVAEPVQYLWFCKSASCC